MRFDVAGGINENGRNCFYVEYEKSKAFLLDCGSGNNEDDDKPRLSEKQIQNVEYIFLSNSDKRNSGALLWILNKNPKITVVASKWTFKQLGFKIKNKIKLEKMSEEQKLKIKKINIDWGRSGYCIGSVWYKIEYDNFSVLYMGDYREKSLIFKTDKIRNIKSELAILDATFENKNIDYETECAAFSSKIEKLLEQNNNIIFSVSKSNRSLEIATLLSVLITDTNFYCDQNLYGEVEKYFSHQTWMKIPCEVFCSRLNVLMDDNIPEGKNIIFISNEFFEDEEKKNLIKSYIEKNTAIVFLKIWNLGH